MKRSTLITVISLLIPLLGMSQTKSSFVDDVYLKPSDSKTTDSSQPNEQTKKAPNYKNGAREIIYNERETPVTKAAHDTLYVVGEENDSTVNNEEQGHYLNGFNGTESDLEYAERIRRFHNPKYEIFIGDPRYNDIYFLNNYDWNVYVDGSYAYVTPTWTNPYWWNYNFSPYSYGSWGFGFNNWYSPYSYYSGLYGSPWGFDSFYGGFGYGGYGYGYGYGGYGYGGYSGYGGYGGFGQYSARNPNHDEGTRRDASNLTGGGRMGGTNSSSQTMIGGGGYYTTNPYTVVSNSKSRAGSQSNISTTTALRATNNSSKVSTSRSIPVNTNGIGQVRTGGLRNSSGLNQSNISRTSGSKPTYTINTTPRTSTRNNSTSEYNPATGNSSPSRSGNSAVINSNSRNYSTGSRSSSPSSSFNTGRSNSSYSNSSPSYNSGSNSSRSSSSYSSGSNSGSNSGSSRSSGSSSSSSSSSNSGSSSGGRR